MNLPTVDGVTESSSSDKSPTSFSSSLSDLLLRIKSFQTLSRLFVFVVQCVMSSVITTHEQVTSTKIHKFFHNHTLSTIY